MGIGGLKGRGRLVPLLLFHFRSVLKIHTRLDCETKQEAQKHKQSEGSTAILRIQKMESSSLCENSAAIDASARAVLESPVFRWGRDAGGGEHNKGLLPNQVAKREIEGKIYACTMGLAPQ